MTHSKGSKQDSRRTSSSLGTSSEESSNQTDRFSFPMDNSAYVICMPSHIQDNFYRCTIESILTGCITGWYGNCSAWDRKVLQRVVKSAQLITGCELPNIQDIYSARRLKKARSILKDPSHPSHKLFSLLPSGKWYRSIRSNRLQNSFYLQAIRLLNSQPAAPLANHL
ncbi:uncharacterized protein [Lepisosteus oculatus]|uniref:uncharacterized protein n=1 Tax=Lepisosteus oculatus TaxID=7918 RepID=UPI0035F50BC5